MIGRRKLIACGTAVVFLAAGLVWSSSHTPVLAQTPAENSWLFTVLKRGKLLWGITPDNPPFAFIDQSGEFAGFDVDLAHILAQAMFGDPAKVDFVKMSNAGRWPAVNQGQIDLGAGGTTIWPERIALVNFTMPLLRAGHGILARADIAARSPAELNDPKYTIARLNLPNQAALLKELLPKADVLVLDTTADLLTAIRSNRAQAMIADRPTAAYNATKLTGLKDLGNIGASADDAIFVRLNDFQWLWYLNTMVQELRCGALYEDYSRSYQKWFGVKPPSQDICIAFSQADFLKAARGEQ